MTFRRIQFTPDLMPSDITGTEILEEDHTTGKRVFKFMRGPIFGNIILADEINRTPPKTQSALLEAMQERQITVGGETYKVPEPFFVLATQNDRRKPPTLCRSSTRSFHAEDRGRLSIPSKRDRNRKRPRPIAAAPKRSLAPRRFDHATSRAKSAGGGSRI
jgi:MoxR-like ATPase